METKILVINEVFAPAQFSRQPEASSPRSVQGRPGIMCADVKLRAELLFGAKKPLSSF